MRQSIAVTASAVALLAGFSAHAQQPTAPRSFADLAMPSAEVTPHEA